MSASGSRNEAPSGLRTSRFLRLLCLSLLACLAAAASAQTSLEAPQTEEDILAFRFAMAGGAVAGPTAVAGRVWVISEDRTLYILNDSGRAVGRRVWKDGTPAWIAPDAFGRAILPSSDGSLVMVNRAGLEVYRVNPGAPVENPVVFGADGRFFAASGSRLAAYSAGGGRIWTVELPSLAVLGPSVRFTSEGKTLVAVAHGDGSIREYDEYGRESLSMAGTSPPAALASLADSLLALYRDGTALIQGGGSGEPIRVQLGLAPLAASPDGRAAWILLSGGRLERMEEDGRLGEAIDTGVTDAQALRVFQNRVLVLGPRGAASVSKDGKVYRDLALRNAPKLPAVTASGIVVSAGEDWILYAYRFERDLGAPAAPAVGFVDFEAARRRAEEEALWNPDFKYDDGVLKELRCIENSVGSASIGAGEPDAVEYCSAIALGYGVREPSPYGGAAPSGPSPASALPRARACDILGELGSPRSVPVLTEAYLRDPDPSVRASAAEALGSIGLDPSGDALRAFQWAAEREYFLDERGALATLDAVEGLYRAQGELSDPAGIRAALRLAGKPYGSAVRTRALAVLRRLSEPAR